MDWGPFPSEDESRPLSGFLATKAEDDEAGEDLHGIEEDSLLPATLNIFPFSLLPKAIWFIRVSAGLGLLLGEGEPEKMMERDRERENNKRNCICDHKFFICSKLA